MASENKTLHCTFCGKSQHDVRVLIYGGGANICNECTDLSWQMVKDHEISGLVGRIVKAVMFRVYAIRDFFAGKSS